MTECLYYTFSQGEKNEECKCQFRGRAQVGKIRGAALVELLVVIAIIGVFLRSDSLDKNQVHESERLRSRLRHFQRQGAKH